MERPECISVSFCDLGSLASELQKVGEMQQKSLESELMRKDLKLSRELTAPTKACHQATWSRGMCFPIKKDD